VSVAFEVVGGSVWTISHKADPEVRPLADRHYNRQKIGSPQFVPPGRALVLKSHDRRAFWITSWPFAEYVRHEWPGAWVCSAFRNEGAEVDGSRVLASEMIRQALACTLSHWPRPPSVPADGGPCAMVTFVDASKVKRSRQPGRCYLKAGFRYIGQTKGGLLALGIGPDALPEPMPFAGVQTDLFADLAS
jgi:hypothetical protein